jgi:ribonuclease HI
MLYTIYTDGSCLKNPGGPGGYAAVSRTHKIRGGMRYQLNA